MAGLFLIMCPIPDFSHNNVLPPHLGNPTDFLHVSPYPCTILELCQKFATSRPRINILIGFISFRARLTNLGIIDGFQWLDGSFMENIEVSENRPPNDLDLVTFYDGRTAPPEATLLANFPEFSNSTLSKQTYHLDHYPVDFCFNPEVTVELTRYWIQLFTHNRNGIWKGILRLPLNTANDDSAALTYLNALTI